MIHRKWIAFAAVTLLLTACTDQNTATSDEKEPAEEQAVSKEEQETEEVKKEEAAKEEAEAEEKPEEVAAADPQYRINSANWSAQPITDASEKVVLVTIDDAPDKHAMEMAETLKSQNVPAIFFVNGHFLDTDEEKQQLKKIHEMGFAIGNHTNSHPNLRDLTEEQQTDEILQLNETIEQIIGEKPKFFRAPHGANTDFSKQLVQDQGMVLMNWTYGYDWEQQYQNAQSLTNIMINTEFLNNGANLLMHDREWTSEALPDIIQGLKDKGYGFVDPEAIEGI
ncbi:polysaccharide deacetylase family protein [Planococcus sp. CPCC 101016]|uniref:polysaccharide deacetylase family protein n=1 Tax=Planococcus sp. CPCC 101016 TaxID=2599617 RepID=UPI0011B70F72|nr:polysaccharide deacetylase family protein [Planococcus sp. CPCC 101016]TWT07388.1 polysaccharide deacetylase family protein [Planococcus sp. CPCC 101016]